VAGELGGEPCVFLLHLLRRAFYCVCCALLDGEYAAQEDKAVDDLGRDVDYGVEGVGSRVGVGAYALLIEKEDARVN
jgi:hypothetical protein